MRKLGRFLSGFLIGLMLCAGTVHAQSATGASSDKQKAILELMQVVGMAKMIDQIVDVSITAMFDVVRKKNPNLSQTDFNIVSDALRQTVRENTPGLIARYAVIYEEVFTYEEIRDINAFYRTPTGQKTLQAMPLIMSRGMQAGLAWGQEIEPLIVERLRGQMKQRGIQLEM